MDPNFGSINMNLIFKKDLITIMDPKFGSIEMNLIFQKDWITSMDPNFGSIKMTLIFQKDCITSMDPKFGSIKMNLIVQICLKQRQVFCVKIWIHEKLPVPGSIKMNYNHDLNNTI